MSTDLVVAAIFMYPMEAKLARAALDSAEIPCFLENEHTLACKWALTPVLGGLRLMVAASGSGARQKILASQVSDEELNAQAEGIAEGDQWVRFYTFDSLLNANMARAFLEAEESAAIWKTRRNHIGRRWLGPAAASARLATGPREWLCDTPMCDDEVVESGPAVGGIWRRGAGSTAEAHREDVPASIPIPGAGSAAAEESNP